MDNPIEKFIKKTDEFNELEQCINSVESELASLGREIYSRYPTGIYMVRSSDGRSFQLQIGQGKSLVTITPVMVINLSDPQ